MTKVLEEMVHAKIVRYTTAGDALFMFGEPDSLLLLHQSAAAAYDPARTILVGVEYNVHARAHLPYFLTGDTARETYERITQIGSVHDREAPKCIFDLAETVANVEPHLPDVIAETARLALGTEEHLEGVVATCTYDMSYAKKRAVPCTFYAPEKNLLFGVYTSGDGFALTSRIGEDAERFGAQFAEEFRDPKRRSVLLSAYLIQFAEQHYALTQRLPILNAFMQEVLRTS